MYICPNCHKTSEQPTNFCSLCGTPMVEQQPAAQPAEQSATYAQPEAPQYPQYPQYTQPQYPQYPQYAQPQYTPAPPSKAKSIVGMILSIAGLFFGGLGTLYNVLFLLMEEGEVGIVFAIVMGMFSVPLSLVGFLLCKSNVNAGDTSTFGRVGKTLGLIALILSGVMLLLGFAGLNESYYF